MNKAFSTKDITLIKDGHIIYKGYYWLCVNGDPTQALFYRDRPQCNKDKKVHEWALKSDSYIGIDGIQITFVDIAYMPPTYESRQ